MNFSSYDLHGCKSPIQDPVLKKRLQWVMLCSSSWKKRNWSLSPSLSQLCSIITCCSWWFLEERSVKHLFLWLLAVKIPGRHFLGVQRKFVPRSRLRMPDHRVFCSFLFSHPLNVWDGSDAWKPSSKSCCAMRIQHWEKLLAFPCAVLKQLARLVLRIKVSFFWFLEFS